MTRRAYAVARGLGLDRPPEGLLYLRPTHPVGTEETQRLVLDAVRRSGAAVVVLDSLTVGAVGDVTEQRDTVRLMKRVEEWGTVLAIDHITKAGAEGNHSAASIFGSTFKRAIARSTLKLTQADGGGLTLRSDKSNFGPGSAPIHFVADFLTNERGEDEVVYRVVGADDESMLGAEAHAPAHEQTFLALLRLSRESGAAVSLAELAAERGVAEKTVRNHLTLLNRDGQRVQAFGDNTYTPLLDIGPSQAHSSPGTVGNGAGIEDDGPVILTEPDEGGNAPPRRGRNR
jgi:hypothetical protein